MRNQRRLYKGLILLIFLVSAIVFSIWQNNSIVVTRTDYENEKIPKPFNDFKIVHISDLHNKLFEKDQKPLLEKMSGETPDIIVITGDLIDQRKYDLEKAMLFIQGAIKIAPVYYVSGNHEAWSGDYETIKLRLKDAGVTVLDNAEIEIVREETRIKLLGLSDPDFLTSSYIEGTNATLLNATLSGWKDEEGFKILLSHRPELFSLYKEANVDLVFSGHAHGGQVRLPFIGGLVAPDQGLFPKFTSGSYTEGSTTLFISRGLGNSIMPQRVLNRPEIVVVTLKHQ